MRDLTTYEDPALLQALRAGDETAFTQIYKRYWRKLYIIAYQRLGSRHSAEDVVHEVFTSLWKNRSAAEIRSLYAYLAAATRYAVFNEVARSGRRSPAEIPDIAEDQTIDLNFLQRMIAEEIHQLPDRCRLVFRYSRETGLSNREIATRMGISEKAVEKHITKAISHLRLQLRHFLHFFL